MSDSDIQASGATEIREENEEMELMQQIIVADHIRELRREAASLRAERSFRGPPNRLGRRHPARVRLGRWLMSLGSSIAGPAGPSGSTGGAVDHRNDGRGTAARAI